MDNLVTLTFDLLTSTKLCVLLHKIHIKNICQHTLFTLQ